MCSSLTLEQALRAYLADKTPESLSAIETTIRDLDKDDRWQAINAIATSTDAELQMALAEAALQTRPATSEEEVLWQNIEGVMYPVFGLLQDNYSNEYDMANLARVIVAYYHTANPEQQAAIINVIKAARDEAGFFGTADELESEGGIYSQIAPEATEGEDEPAPEPTGAAPTT